MTKKRASKDRPDVLAGYLTIADLVARYRVSRATIWSWRRRGFLPQGVRFGGVVRFPAEEILAFESRQAATTAEHQNDRERFY